MRSKTRMKHILPLLKGDMAKKQPSTENDQVKEKEKVEKRWTRLFPLHTHLFLILIKVDDNTLYLSYRQASHPS